MSGDPDRSVLFERVAIGESLRTNNRLALTATGLGVIGDALERYGDNVRGYVSARAAGGAGMIILPALGIGRLDLHLPDDPGADSWLADQMSYVEPLAAASHGHGVPIGIQLMHRGSQVPRGLTRLGPSENSWRGDSRPVATVSDRQAARLGRRFAHAAALARAAGFDFVEIHAGHGYLLSAFLSPRFNTRSEGEYPGVGGGVRLVEQIIRDVRRRAGSDFPISLRVSADERIEGGLRLHEALPLIDRLAPLVELLNVSGGTYGADPPIVASHDTPFGYNAGLGRAVAERVNVPVLSAGRQWNLDQMLSSVVTGGVALVGLGRALWADPDLPRKLEQGRMDDIRPAIGCNQGCIDRSEDELRTCLVNPRFGQEQRMITRTGNPRRVLVVGGGPAGMEVARIAAERGHAVRLVERQSHLGGRFRVAARVPGKQEFGRYIDWLARQMIAAGVNLELGREVRPGGFATEGTDVLIVATGARAGSRDIAGRRGIRPEAAVAEPYAVGERVLVFGGDQLHLEAALALAVTGRRVTLCIEQGHPPLGAQRRSAIVRQLKHLSVEIHRDVGPDIVEELDPDVECDLVAGVLTAEVPDLTGVTSIVHVVGDAARSGTAMDAIAHAYRIGEDL